jgi:hypothetical protein
MSLPASPQPPIAPRILHHRTTSLRRDMPTPGKRAIPIRTREGGNEGSFEKSTGVCAQSYRDEGAKRRWLGRGYRTIAGHDNSRELEPITKAIRARILGLHVEADEKPGDWPVLVSYAPRLAGRWKQTILTRCAGDRCINAAYGTRVGLDSCPSTAFPTSQSRP